MTTKTIESASIEIGDTSFQMIKVESGTFWMGDKNNQPIHKVAVDNFMIGQYTVTQALWYEVMKETDMVRPARFQGNTRPVEQVSWEDAILFCNKLSQLKGQSPAYDEDGNHIDENKNPTWDMTKVKGFRLPTEAEWEYAAMGGHLVKMKNEVHFAEYKYAGSNGIDDVAWNDYNSNQESKDVGLKLPNQLGLFDMSGNVWEWCWDYYDSDYYQKCLDKGIVTNPTGGKGSDRVFRGGGWFSNPQLCRVSHRGGWFPGDRSDDIGFRLACAFQSAG